MNIPSSPEKELGVHLWNFRHPNRTIHFRDKSMVKVCVHLVSIMVTITGKQYAEYSHLL